jgi:MFS transporter, SHS family, lactate transporter
MASGFITYYSINALFATHLQKDLGLSPMAVAMPIMLASIGVLVLLSHKFTAYSSFAY